MGVNMRTLFHNTSRVSLLRRLAATLMLMLFVFPVFTGSTFRLSADEDTEVDYLAEYEAIFYDSYDGLVSAQINAVAQTDDGYIWVGTYSGLYRYDGQKFAKSNVSSEIYSVMALYVDSKGVLWIGTNDSGLFGFDPATGEVSHISVKEPPHEPRQYLFAFMARIARASALNRAKALTREKRSAKLVELTDELESMLPSPHDTAGEAEAAQLGRAIGDFLKGLPDEKRVVFVQRYWYALSVKEIALTYSMSEGKVKTILFRTRNELKKHLLKQGFLP